MPADEVADYIGVTHDHLVTGSSLSLWRAMEMAMERFFNTWTVLCNSLYKRVIINIYAASIS